MHIDRQETKDLLEWIAKLSTNKEVAFLLDMAGAGKSVIMKDLLESLETKGIVVLAIKADTLSSITNESQLQEALNLSDSLEAMFSVASKNKTTILLIDQLDALSLTFARNQNCLDLMMRLITRVARINNVRVIVSCRDFDHKFDPKLQQLDSKEFKIKPLDRVQIEQVLDKIHIKWESLTPNEHNLLTNPQYLLSYANVVVEKSARGEPIVSFDTIQDVYHELWKLRVLHSRGCTASPEELQDCIYTLVDAIHSTQLLTQPVSILDQYPATCTI